MNYGPTDLDDLAKVPPAEQYARARQRNAVYRGEVPSKPIGIVTDLMDKLDAAKSRIGILEEVVARLSLERDELLGKVRVLENKVNDPFGVNATLASITVRDCLHFVGKHYGLNPRDMISESRSRQLAWARQVVMWLARRYTKQSLPQIGRILGRRDHTSILHGCGKVETEISNQTELGAEALRVEAALLKARPALVDGQG